MSSKVVFFPFSLIHLFTHTHASNFDTDQQKQGGTRQQEHTNEMASKKKIWMSTMQDLNLKRGRKCALSIIYIFTFN